MTAHGLRQKPRVVFATFMLLVVHLASASAQPLDTATPVEWEVTDRSGVFIEGELISLSPDGRWIAGIDMDNTFCVWELATAEARCDGADLNLDTASVRWSPDSTAVAFSQGPYFLDLDSDIFVFERATGVLANVTNDGYEGTTFVKPGEHETLPVDSYPAWSADSQSLTFIRFDLAALDRLFTVELVSIPRSGGEVSSRYAVRDAEPGTMSTPIFALRDGSLLFTVTMIEDEDGANGIWLLDPAGAPRQLLASTGDGEIHEWVRLIRIVETDAGAVVSAISSDPTTMEVEDTAFLLDVSTGSVTLVDEPVLGFSPDGRSTLAWTEQEQGGELLTITDPSGNVTEISGGQDLDRGDFRGYDWAANNTILIPIVKTFYNDGGGLLVTVRGDSEATPVTS